MCIRQGSPLPPDGTPECADVRRKRELLEAADLCRACPQAPLLDDERGPGCRCTRALTDAVHALLHQAAPGPREIPMDPRGPDGGACPGSCPTGCGPSRKAKP
ncbi:hypothetical protein [Desulfocurvus vexinensis]|uniref:hypothetical protein n=1 Tax=Desulfocurvus vexinensis TaxID=399548 RepID=UPI0004B03413|nr:hypothetical protein [Desulfocurvus vexinensis]